MTLGDLKQELVILQGRLKGVKLLDSDGTRALAEALGRISAALAAPKVGKGKHRRHPRWRLVIRPDLPLSFVPTTTLKHRLKIDIHCDLSEPTAGAPTGSHNIAVRVWALDKSLWFREAFDATTLADQIAASGRRVVCRFHLDLANPGQLGPRFHLQIGGNTLADEFYWHPKTLDVPRFCHHPLNLLLTCEFILKTFYPEHYDQVADDPTWAAAVKVAQKSYLAPYFERLHNFDESLLLRRLWN